jgi:hypothetical protein
VLQAMVAEERAGMTAGAGGQVALALLVPHGSPIEALRVTPEHLRSLSFVLGAALAEDRLTPVYEGFHPASLSMRSLALRAGPLPAESPQ